MKIAPFPLSALSLSVESANAGSNFEPHLSKKLTSVKCSDKYMEMLKIRYGRVKVVGKWLIAVGVLAVASYPIIIFPMIDPEPYKEMQKIGRKNIVQENIQPGNMKVWSDPFGRKKQTVEEGKQGVFFKGF